MKRIKAMLKYSLISILCLLIPFYSIGQSLGKPGATWVYLHHSFWDGPIPAKHSYRNQIKIDSFIYDDVFHSSGYHFYFTERENKLYFIQYNQRERLLIDKNAGIGDFWFVEPPANSIFYQFFVEVLDTGSIIINNIRLKKWDLKYTHLDPNYQEEYFDIFVERIGSMERFIDPYDEFFENTADAGIGGQLICYSDGEFFYERKPGTCKTLLHNFETNYDIPLLLWDPQNMLLQLQKLQDIQQIIIYDFLGRQLVSQPIQIDECNLKLKMTGGIVKFIYKNGLTISKKFI